MRKLIAPTFTSLDGVMQAPGAPTEDPTGNFVVGRSLSWMHGMDFSASGFDGKDREFVIGSGNLIQTLQAASLIDEYNVWTYPVVLGRGKRLFENGARPCALRLVASKVSTTGVVMSTYVLAGDVLLGSFAQPEPSAKEVERRAKLVREANSR